MISSSLILLILKQMAEEKTEYITTSEPQTGYHQVLDAHSKLNSEIDALNEKVERVMDRHEG